MQSSSQSEMPSSQPASEMQSSAQSEVCRQKKAKPLLLTPDKEDSLVEWLKENECMYGKKLNSYKDNAMRNRQWQENADELDLEAAIRTHLGKLTRTVSDDGAADLIEKDKCILDHFDFLLPHIVCIKGCCAGGLKVKLAQ